MPTYSITFQCRATSRSGERCKKHVLPGALVCENHGGKAPQALRGTQERLQLAAPLAAQRLVDIITPRASCDHCGRTDADRDPMVLAACKVILERCGLDALHPEEVDHSWLGFLTDEQLETIDLWLREAQAKAEARAREEAGIIDLKPEPNTTRAGSSNLALYRKRGDSFDADHLPEPKLKEEDEDED